MTGDNSLVHDLLIQRLMRIATSFIEISFWEQSVIGDT